MFCQHKRLESLQVPNCHLSYFFARGEKQPTNVSEFSNCGPVVAREKLVKKEMVLKSWYNSFSMINYVCKMLHQNLVNIWQMITSGKIYLL